MTARRFPSDRLSVNPLAYWMTGTATQRTPEVVARAFTDAAAAGFGRVKADVPDGGSPAEYRAWLDELGLRPGLSMFLSTLDRATKLADDLERARRYAGEQSVLGARATMISAIFVPERTPYPTLGAGYRAERLAQVIDDLGAIAEVLTAEGVRPLLHPHVSGWIETEYETERTLEDIPASILGFGPDTGHLAWAGMDPVAMIARHADRVGGLHVKDLQPSAFDKIGGDYSSRTGAGSVWTEPGTGVIDFDAVFAALPADFDGEFVIEVDVPTVSPVDSLVAQRRWAERYFA